MSVQASRKVAIAGALFTLFYIGAGSVMAQTPEQVQHPRRAEVDHRLKHQEKRIHNEVKTGEISKTQAHALHKEDHQIRKEEHAMASQNNGHITKLEQKTLNQQENKVSKEIGK